jgi:hypothetical protein
MISGSDILLLRCVQALSGDGPPLDECLLKNVYANDPSKHPYAQLLSQYLLLQERCLTATDTEQVLLGQIRFTQRLTGQQRGQGKDGDDSEDDS